MRMPHRTLNGIKFIFELPVIRSLRPVADLIYVRVARTYRAGQALWRNWIPLRVRFRMALRPPIEVQGVRLRVWPMVSRVMRRHMYEGKYVDGEINLVDRYLKPNDRVMELGGGLGVISAFCARRVGSENVVTFEGNPALEPYILETWASNGVTPQLVPALIGSEEGETDFYIGPSTWNATMAPRERDLQRNRLRLPVRSFNKERRRFDPTFVVMDIEGAEYEVVQQAEWGNVRGLVIEMHPWYLGPQKTATLKACLARAGFVLQQQDQDEMFLYFSRAPRDLPAEWSFSFVADHFEDHIERSVPGYREGHSVICRLADAFIQDDSRIYELGCSTGALARALLARHKSRQGLRYVGIDTSQRMVDVARRRGKDDPRTEYRVADAGKFNLDPCDVVISYYTLQFIPLSERPGIVGRVHQALKPGGAFFLFEKVRPEDPQFEALAVLSLHCFKHEQGFSEKEIRAKDSALVGVMNPLGAAENEALLQEAGFTKIFPIALFLPFQGWLAIR